MRVLDLFEARAVDYAMPDAMRCGGFTEMKKIGALAEASGVRFSPHCFATGVGLAATMAAAASTPAFEWLEFDVTDNPLQEASFIDDLTVEDGRVALPTEPGLGVSLTDEVLEHAVE